MIARGKLIIETDAEAWPPMVQVAHETIYWALR
jgi:hypothetical protein